MHDAQRRAQLGRDNGTKLHVGNFKETSQDPPRILVGNQFKERLLIAAVANRSTPINCQDRLFHWSALPFGFSATAPVNNRDNYVIPPETSARQSSGVTGLRCHVPPGDLRRRRRYFSRGASADKGDLPHMI